MRIPYKKRFAKHSRRGNIVVLAAILLVLVFAMVAFAVDIGYICHADAELQRTADACALTAVQHLPDQSAASLAAQKIATWNKGTVGPDIKTSDIEFGTWDRDTATFTSTTVRPNAVRVAIERSSRRGNPLSLFFANIMGISEANVTAAAIAMYDNSLCGPLVGVDWISVTGSPVTDSYRSSDGSYDFQIPRDKGSLCSDGPIDVEGSATVNGNANAGRGCDTTLYGGAVVTGNTSPRLRPLNIPEVDTSAISASNDNPSLPPILKGKNYVEMLDGSRNFTLDGGRSYTIPPGDYYFNDMILTGQSTLTVSPGVNIYLSGKLDTSGGDVINSSQIPNNLRIFMTGSTARIAGNSDNHMIVYAPNTAVEITGSSAFHGAAVGKTLTLSGDGSVHYDESLKLDDALDLPKRVTLVQ